MWSVVGEVNQKALFPLPRLQRSTYTHPTTSRLVRENQETRTRYFGSSSQIGCVDRTHGPWNWSGIKDIEGNGAGEGHARVLCVEPPARAVEGLVGRVREAPDGGACGCAAGQACDCRGSCAERAGDRGAGSVQAGECVAIDGAIGRHYFPCRPRWNARNQSSSFAGTFVRRPVLRLLRCASLSWPAFRNCSLGACKPMPRKTS